MIPQLRGKAPLNYLAAGNASAGGSETRQLIWITKSGRSSLSAWGREDSFAVPLSSSPSRPDRTTTQLIPFTLRVSGGVSSHNL